VDKIMSDVSNDTRTGPACLTGKRVFITGGAAGIGAALVRRFAKIGARVAFCDIDERAVVAMQADVSSARGWVANVTDEAQMETCLSAVLDHLGGIDIVCANAGTGGPTGLIEDLSYSDWMDCVQVNLGGAFLACRWAAKLMRAQQGGVILLTSSTAALGGFPNRTPYASAKWGVVGLAKTLASELGAAGVRVNAILPGSVSGDRIEAVMQRTAASRGVSVDVLRAEFTEGTAMKTFVEGQDIADLAVFLASSQARYISGQAIAVDGFTESLV
jgi:NAD(P)-dependent dehydrogenase (short-subunit alcohol dehydrogenase family)